MLNLLKKLVEALEAREQRKNKPVTYVNGVWSVQVDLSKVNSPEQVEKISRVLRKHGVVVLDYQFGEAFGDQQNA